jgi:hypothetical protein
MAAYLSDSDDIKDVTFDKSELDGDLSPLHQICPKPGQTLRIALLSEFCKPKGAYYHWYRGGFYRCNTAKDGPEAECCRKVQRSWTCVCLALLYMNAESDGKLARQSDIKYRIGYASFARTAFSEVSEFQKAAPGCDLYYSKDEHYLLRGASTSPRWKESPQSAKVATEAARWADGAKLIEKLGKKVTDIEWARLIKTGSTAEIEDE